MTYDLNQNGRTLHVLVLHTDGRCALYHLGGPPGPRMLTRRLAAHYLAGWRWLVRNRPESGYTINRYPLT